MVQKFLDDEEENRFFTVWQGIVNQTFLDIQKYFDLAYGSKELGSAIYDAHAMAIYNIIQKSLFVRAYNEIVQGEKVNGTIDGYIRILYAIFGGDADIQITTTPLSLKITIKAKYQHFALWFTKASEQVITKDGDRIVFKAILADVTQRDLMNLLNAMKNAGQHVEFELIEE